MTKREMAINILKNLKVDLSNRSNYCFEASVNDDHTEVINRGEYIHSESYHQASKKIAEAIELLSEI